MSRNGQLVKNTSFFFIGNLGSKAISFLMIPLYTIWLSPSEYGVTDLLQTYNQILILFLGLGITESLIVFPINKPENEIKKQFSTALLFLLGFHLLFAIGYYLLSLFNLKGAYFEYLWFALGYLLTNSLLRLFQNFCCGINKMSVFSFTGILSAVGLALLSFLLIPHYGVVGFLSAGILSSLITLFFIIIYSKAYKYFSFNGFSRKCLIEQLKYSIPLIPNSLMWWLILGMNRPLMEKYVGIAVIGLFAIASKIPSLMDMLYNLFQQAWLVTATKEIDNDDFSSYYSRLMDFIISIQSFVCMALMFLSDWIIHTFCDARYAEASVFVPILCLGIIFSNLSTFSGTVFSASKKTKYLFYSILIAAIVSIVLNFTLIPVIGVWGAIASILASHMIACISRLYYSEQFVELINKKSLFLTLLLSCAFCSTCYISTPSIRYISQIVVFSIFCLMKFYIPKEIIKRIKAKYIKH